jgi:hypothetical protein
VFYKLKKKFKNHLYPSLFGFIPSKFPNRF